MQVKTVLIVKSYRLLNNHNGQSFGGMPSYMAPCLLKAFTSTKYMKEAGSKVCMNVQVRIMSPIATLVEMC